MRIWQAVSTFVLPALLGACANQSSSRANPGVHESRHLLGFDQAVRSILQDSRGHYWFGSWNEGVARFDGERLTYLTTDDGLTDNQVRRIVEDHNGVVWFENGRGVSTFDGNKITPHSRRDYLSRADWRLAPLALWFKSDEPVGYNELEAEPGVYRLDGTSLTYLTLPLPQDRENDAYYSITGIATGEDGRIWVATYGAVIGYDDASFTIIDNQSLGLSEDTGFLHIRCVFEDSTGRLWIGNNGIGVLLRDGHETTNFTQELGVGRRDSRTGGSMEPRSGDAPDGAPTLHRVFSIGEDRAGGIWFGTIEHGAWRYDGESLTNFTDADGLTTSDVLAIYTDSRGDLLLAGQGVFRFNGESFDRIH